MSAIFTLAHPHYICLVIFTEQAGTTYMISQSACDSIIMAKYAICKSLRWNWKCPTLDGMGRTKLLYGIILWYKYNYATCGEKWKGKPKFGANNHVFYPGLLRFDSTLINCSWQYSTDCFLCVGIALDLVDDEELGKWRLKTGQTDWEAEN